MSSTSAAQNVFDPLGESEGWRNRMGFVDPAEGQSGGLKPRKKKKGGGVKKHLNIASKSLPSLTSTYMLSCKSVWMVVLSSSLVMCVGLMVRPSPFVSALTALSNWSPNRGIPSTGTAWYTAWSRLFCPPWVMKRRTFLWPEVNRRERKNLKG